MAYKFIKWFEELRKDDVPLVGGKGANLGEMTNAGIPVPPGFCVTAEAYKYFVENVKVSKEDVKKILGEKANKGTIAEVLASAPDEPRTLQEWIMDIINRTNVDDSKQLQENTAIIRELIESLKCQTRLQMKLNKLTRSSARGSERMKSTLQLDHPLQQKTYQRLHSRVSRRLILTFLVLTML